MPTSISTIGKNIVLLRDSLGLSQKKFSELGEISPATLVNIESGKKSFRIKSLERIMDLTGITLESISSESFKPPKNIREKLLKKYENESQISVILNESPTLQYSIKHVLLKTDFLNYPKEINDIRIYLAQRGLVYKGNSIHVALKRMPDLIEIRPHEGKKNTNVYLRREMSNII